jgi:hypothetical protein
MNITVFFEQFQDYLAPRLDTYEQAIYLYLFRHTRFIGESDAVIGFKSARKRIATGIGEKGKPMSEGTAYEKLRSLQAKGCIRILDTERDGSRIALLTPEEIPGVVPVSQMLVDPDLETLDFFSDERNRSAILEREHHSCFYCHRTLTPTNYVIEHVISRPAGDNSYRNIVAACRDCNNRKNDQAAEDFLRDLYRNNLLTKPEFDERTSALQDLKNGLLKPP